MKRETVQLETELVAGFKLSEHVCNVCVDPTLVAIKQQKISWCVSDAQQSRLLGTF
jgi:hypothetical protein